MKKSTLFIIGVCLILIGGGLTYRYLMRDTDSRGATKLMRALEEHDSFKDTAKLIDKTADIDVADKKGKTALLYAAKYAREKDVVKKLLEAGADIHHQDKNGHTAVWVAARENPSAAVMKALIDAGANVNILDENGYSPLMLALQNNIGPVIEVLLHADTSVNLLDEKGALTAQLLSENIHISDVEKNNYRQVLLILSILQAREKANASAAISTGDVRRPIEIDLVSPRVEEDSTAAQESVEENADSNMEEDQPQSGSAQDTVYYAEEENN